MTIPDITTMSRYVSPINPAVFPHLTLVLMAIGLFFTAWFFVYEVGFFFIYRMLYKVLSTGDLNQVHQGGCKRAGIICCCLSLHGIWNSLPSALGWNLCLEEM